MIPIRVVTCAPAGAPKRQTLCFRVPDETALQRLWDSINTELSPVALTHTVLYRLEAGEPGARNPVAAWGVVRVLNVTHGLEILDVAKNEWWSWPGSTEVDGAYMTAS